MERRDPENEAIPPQPQYLTKQQLIARTGLSAATIQRYKRDRKIPFFQVGGPGAKVLFPLNAIEAARQVSDAPASPTTHTVPPPADGTSPQQRPGSQKLPGRRPRWKQLRGEQE
jgi:hypothetical protein